jgi:hypothetical protein
MPILAGLIASLFGGISSFFVFYFGKKVAIVAFAVTGFGLALTSLMILFNSLVTPFLAAMFSTQYGQFLGLAFPPIAGSCITAISLSWSACALYKLKIQSIKMSASA